MCLASVEPEIVFVNTSFGRISGRIVSVPFGEVTGVTVEQYLGIPFALQPFSVRRFADPVPLEGRPTGTLMTTLF